MCNLILTEILPPEIILHIISMLDYDSVKILRLVSREFKYFAHKQFADNLLIKIQLPGRSVEWNSMRKTKSLIEIQNSLAEIQKTVNFKNVKIREIDFTAIICEDILNFWSLFYDSTEHLILQHCGIKHQKLLQVLENFKKLDHVSLHFTTHYDIIEVIDKLAFKAKSVTLSGNTWGRGLLSITSNVDAISADRKPTIEELIIQSSYNYCNPEVTALFRVLEISLKHLDLPLMWYGEKWDHQYDQLNWLSEFDFKLESLKINLIGDTNRRTLNRLAKKNKNLLHFEMTWDVQMESIDFVIITTQLTNLRVLKLNNRAYDHVDYKVLDLSFLHHLETLCIDSTNKLRASDKMREIIFSPKAKNSFKYLDLKCTFSDDVVLSIAENLISLKSLTLNTGDSRHFPQQHLPLIFTNLINLETLKIDAILPTANSMLHDETSATIANLQELRTLHLIGIYDCPEVSFRLLHKLPKLRSIYYREVISDMIHEQNILDVVKHCRHIKWIALNLCPTSITFEDSARLSRQYPQVGAIMIA